MMELLEVREGMTALQQRRLRGQRQRAGGADPEMAAGSPEEDEALDELSRIVEFVKRRVSSESEDNAGKLPVLYMHATLVTLARDRVSSGPSCLLQGQKGNLWLCLDL